MAGFRLNSVEDADIIKDLARYRNKSDRIKQAYRKAMQLEQGFVAPFVAPSVAPSVDPAEAKLWVIPEEPTVKKQVQTQGSVKANILYKNNF